MLIQPNMESERVRLSDARLVRIGSEAQWWRNLSRGSLTGGWFGSGSGLLTGPFGDMLRGEFEGSFASGPEPNVVEATSTAAAWSHGYPVRWAQLLALCDPSFHPGNLARDQRSLLYRKGLAVTGELADANWAQVREDAGLDRVMKAKQSITLGEGSVAVRPTLVEWQDGKYYPVGLTTVHADSAMVIPDPARPDRPLAFAEYVDEQNQSGPVIVWDMRDPFLPLWGKFETVQSWLGGDRWVWGLRGRAYPYWYRGKAIMPVVCAQESEQANSPLPVSRPLLQGCLDLIKQRAWVMTVYHSGIFNKAMLLSQEKMNGLRQIMLDPVVINNIWGQGTSSIAIIPENSQAAERAWGMHRDRVEEWASAIDTGLEVRESKSAKSGAALLLELTGKYIFRQRLVTQARPVDRAIIESLIAANNWLEDTGQKMGGSLGRLSEGEFALEYPHYWNQVEKAQIRGEMQEAVDAHRESPEIIWLLDHDMEDDGPGGPNRALADAGIKNGLLKANEYAPLGYGVEWKDLWLGQAGAAANLTVEKTVDNGGALLVGQIDGARSIIADVVAGQISKEVGIAQLTAMIGLDAVQAALTIGEVAPMEPETYDATLRDTTASDVQATVAADGLRKLGYNADVIKGFLTDRGVTGGALAEAETLLVETFTPPPEVSRAATRGLNLRKQFKRGSDGMSPQGKVLIGRAKKLRDGTDFTRGEVLELDVWLEAHKDDANLPAADGAWGDDADPSSAWVDWLTQGGEDGLAWTNGVLTAEPEGEGEEPDAPVEEDATIEGDGDGQEADDGRGGAETEPGGSGPEEAGGSQGTGGEAV